MRRRRDLQQPGGEQPVRVSGCRDLVARDGGAIARQARGGGGRRCPGLVRATAIQQSCVVYGSLQYTPEYCRVAPNRTPSPHRVVDKMRELRPIVETGYENILLVRLLIEEVRYSTAWLDPPSGVFWWHHAAVVQENFAAACYFSRASRSSWQACTRAPAESSEWRETHTHTNSSTKPKPPASRTKRRPFSKSIFQHHR